MRDSGNYAVVGGREVLVDMKRRDGVTVYLDGVRRDIPIDDLDDLVKVVTTATWRGERVVVSHVAPDEVSFYTSSRQLADEAHLAGDQYGGWSGVAPSDELSDIAEERTSVHPRRYRS